MKEYSFLVVQEHINDYEAAAVYLEQKLEEIMPMGWRPVGPASICVTNWKVYMLLTVERDEQSGETTESIHPDVQAPLSD